MEDSHVTQLRDGRDLGWLELGSPDGSPVMAFHGTPGSRLQLALEGAAMSESGLRFICPDRPGYGLSTFQPRRRLIDWPADVTQLADHLKIDKFAVMGISGGGPHAAVCPALLADRVTSTAIVSGVGPLGDPRSAEGMMKFNQVLTKLSQRRSPIVLAIMSLQVALARRWPAWAFEMMLKQLPNADVAILRREDVRSMILRDLAITSRTTARAAAQDFELFASDWGFDLGAITGPVSIWQGDADRNVPAGHATLLHEAIAGSVLHEFPGEGHFLVLDHFEEIAASLRS